MTALFRNTLAIAATYLSSQLYSFLLAPIMIARLGFTLFGVWTVVGAIATYATVLDAGLTRALSRFVAIYDAAGDERAIRECIGLGLLAFSLIGVVVIPVAWLAGPLMTSALGHVSVIQMRQILLASAAIFVVQGYSSVLQALPQGLRRMLPPNSAVVAGNTVNFAASVGVLIASRSLVPYAWANAAAESVSAAFVLISVRYVWRSRLVAVPTRGRLREVLAFSLRSQVGWLADLVNLQSDKIILGLLVGPQAAAVYQLGSSVAGAVRTVGAISIGAIIPSAATAIAEQGRDVVRRLALQYIPRALSVSLPIFVVTAVCAPFLFTVWIDRPARGVVPVLIVLNVAYAVNIVTGVPSTLSIADNRPGFVSRNSLQMAALNLVLTLVLAPLFGLAGVVAGTVVAISTISMLFVVSFARAHRITAAEMRRAVLPTAALATVPALPLIPLVVLARHLGHARPAAAALLVGVVALYVAMYWPAASRMGVLPRRLTLRRAARPTTVV